MISKTFHINDPESTNNTISITLGETLGEEPNMVINVIANDNSVDCNTMSLTRSEALDMVTCLNEFISVIDLIAPSGPINR